MFTSVQKLIDEVVGVLEKDVDPQDVEASIMTFLSALAERGGKIRFPKPESGPSRVVHVGCAGSREKAGAKRKA